MNKKIQMSETFSLGALLAISGGFMDAYSYIFRDQVFANAQTGNIILFSINLAKGSFNESLKYFWPIIAFAFGIVLVEIMKFLFKNSKFHWRQICVLFEIIILSIIAFIPTDYNLLANSLTSFACGIQLESFRKIYSNAIATTMCIGNLRSGTENLCNFFITRDKSYLKRTFLYYGIILCFAFGAILGDFFIEFFQVKAILMCSLILFVVLLLMFSKESEVKNSFFN